MESRDVGSPRQAQGKAVQDGYNIADIYVIYFPHIGSTATGLACKHVRWIVT